MIGRGDRRRVDGVCIDFSTAWRPYIVYVRDENDAEMVLALYSIGRSRTYRNSVLFLLIFIY